MMKDRNLRSMRSTAYRLPLAALVAFSLALIINFIVSSQGSTPTDDEVNKIAKQLYCPVCESTPLDVCPTEACRQWREVIRTMLAEGKSEAEIKQHFVTQYGVRVLNVPPNPWLTYFVPGVVILLGALFLARGFQLWMKPGRTGTDPVKAEAEPVPQDDYVAKMEEELKKRK
jgi:cytochrome c-type biogenesis protein CcmH